MPIKVKTKVTGLVKVSSIWSKDDMVVVGSTARDVRSIGQGVKLKICLSCSWMICKLVVKFSRAAFLGTHVSSRVCGGALGSFHFVIRYICPTIVNWSLCSIAQGLAVI